MSHRSLPVPDGLDGERADAGLARLLGVSRTRGAELGGFRAGEDTLEAAHGRAGVGGDDDGIGGLAHGARYNFTGC